MAHEADIRAELERLRTQVPEVSGALAAGVDGMVLAQDIPAAGPEAAAGVAALTAAALGIGLRLTDATGRAAFRELLVRGEDGCVAIYAAGPVCALTVLAGPRVNVGRLHLEARRAGARIAQLIDGTQDRLEDARPS
jgi:hypothetical protein